MDIKELLEPFEKMLADISAPAAVRAVDAGGSADAIWSGIAESGFLDALVPESAGGAGLSLAQTGALIQALGKYAVPVPVAQTMVARALLAEAGVAAPEGAILLLSPTQTDGAWGQQGVPSAQLASHALVDLGDRVVLADLAGAIVEPTGLHGSRGATVRWNGAPDAIVTMSRPENGLRPLAAVLRAAEIAGAADYLLQTTVTYAGDRVQFGKPIGKLQAIQQQLSVMAEQTLLARFAAAAGCSQGFPAPLIAAATAKQVASSTVPTITAVAHAVHGAIGITEEYDLQLYTRRLHEWRMADGSDSYWARFIGEVRLSSDAATSVDFVREAFSRKELVA